MSYKTWVANLRKFRVKKTGEKDWTCPYCALKNSTKAADQKKYQEHISLMNCQYKYIEEVIRPDVL
jgi:uncharacterized ferredoxin-like protein